MSFNRWCALVLALGIVGCQPRARVESVSRITSSIDTYRNVVVTVEGQVLTAISDPPTTSRGYYVLQDESQLQGIRILSKRLPAVGEMFRVTGRIEQDPANALQLVLREQSRGSAGNLYFYLMVGSGVLAVMLLGVLGYLLLRKPAPTPQPAPAVVMPPFEPPPYRPVSRTAPDQDNTVPFKYTGEDETIAFEYWGYKVEVLEGPDQGRSVQLGVSPFQIGRSGGRANQLELSDRTVSRSQCAIRRHPKTGEFSLEHQGGTNETFVDGKPVQVAELHDGARIRFGSTVIRFTREGQ